MRLKFEVVVTLEKPFGKHNANPRKLLGVIRHNSRFVNVEFECNNFEWGSGWRCGIGDFHRCNEWVPLWIGCEIEKYFADCRWRGVDYDVSTDGQHDFCLRVDVGEERIMELWVGKIQH